MAPPLPSSSQLNSARLTTGLLCISTGTVPGTCYSLSVPPPVRFLASWAASTQDVSASKSVEIHSESSEFTPFWHEQSQNVKKFSLHRDRETSCEGVEYMDNREPEHAAPHAVPENLSGATARVRNRFHASHMNGWLDRLVSACEWNETNMSPPSALTFQKHKLDTHNVQSTSCEFSSWSLQSQSPNSNNVIWMIMNEQKNGSANYKYCVS